MKRNLILLAIAFILALSVAAPVALTGNDIATGDDTTVAGVFTFEQGNLLLDPHCPVGGGGGSADC